MKLENIRTFLEVADCGNFNRAAENLNVTQSTVSARIKSLEEHFGLQLFKRARSGVELSGPGRRFHGEAVNMLHFWQRANQTVTLPEGYQDVLALAAQVSLWERLILPWIPWMRAQAKSVALRVDADYSPSQMRQLADGLLDIGVMYQPRRAMGLVIEELFQEALVLVSTRPRKATKSWIEDYVFVDWGDIFREMHTKAFPDIETPAVSVGLGDLGLRYVLENGGSGYFPLRVVGPMITEGALFRVDEAPVGRRPVYAVYSEAPGNPEVLALALEGLRLFAQDEVMESE